MISNNDQHEIGSRPVGQAPGGACRLQQARAGGRSPRRSGKRVVWTVTLEVLLLVVLGSVVWLRFTDSGKKWWAGMFPPGAAEPFGEDDLGQGTKAPPAEAEQQAVDALNELDAVFIATDLHTGAATNLNYAEPEVDDERMRQIGKLARLVSLQLAETNVNDEQLRHLEELSQLSSLHLGGTPITDAGLAHLSGLSSLEALHLTETAVTDAGLPHVTKISSLTILDLSGTRVTDEGLKQLARMPNLKHLLFQRTEVTDAGLKHLAAMKGLGRLTLRDSKATEQGVEQIKQSIPGLMVDF